MSPSRSDPPRIKEARKYLDRAESALRKTGNPSDLAYVLTERVRLALLKRKPAQASAAVDQALQSVGEDDLEHGRALFLKGRALAMKNQPDQVWRS